MFHIGRKKHFVFISLFLMLLMTGASYAQSAPQILPNPFQPPTESWGQLPPGRTWGAIGGTSFDSKGNLWVFERCGANSCVGSDISPVVELDPSGKMIKTFGSGMFVLPHSIYVDKQDNVWVVDADAKNGKGSQITKFSPDGKVLMTLGTAGVSADGPDTFNSPTGIVIGANGDIFVTDGHGGKVNMRVVKFSKDGKFLQVWGKRGSGPGEFSEPHSITMDSKGRIFIADRGNSRIQIFDQKGEFLDQWKQFGIPSGVFIDKNDTLYVAENRYSPDWQRGIRIGSAKDGTVTGFIPDPDQTQAGGGVGPESVNVDAKGNLYGGEVDRKMIKRYVKK